MNYNNINKSNYSLVGKKILLGLSGLILLGFIVGHLLGNLSILAGPDAINSYAHFLHKNTFLLYIARIILLIALFVHVYLSISLTLINKKARQTNYIHKQNINSTFASETMIYTGFFILFFLVYHLLHFTFGAIKPEFYGLRDEQDRFDVYTMVVNSFSNGFISVYYMASLTCLGFHLSHAFFSVCQTLSIITTRKSIYIAKRFSKVLSIIIIVGYMLIPTTILMEMVSCT